MIKRIVKPIYTLLKKAYYFLVDSFESLFSLRDELTPSRSLVFVGDGDFKKTGQEFLKHFIKLGGLKKSDYVLDVGCGIGRMAVPLTQYLSSEGRYEGFDIVNEGINWCTKNITSKFPNFKFQLADVSNPRYHRDGKQKSSAYQFPYDDQSFDFIFLTSVFTHMLPDEVENYLSQISRVLKPNGKCFITFFLLNPESLGLIEKKKSKFDFSYNYGECRIEYEDAPENVVSYNEILIRNLYKKYQLIIVEPIHYGSWCSRKDFVSFQDIIVATKK
jgi:ubiquinone/menaquinone biosynthesis C-methylase UbiE